MKILSRPHPLLYEEKQWEQDIFCVHKEYLKKIGLHFWSCSYNGPILALFNLLASFNAEVESAILNLNVYIFFIFAH